jgi:hypothetical protein
MMGLLSVARVHQTKDVFTCATPKLFVTLSTIAFSFLMSALNPDLTASTLYEASPERLPLARVAAAAALICVGAKLGEGCTMGNGVQGLATLSPASLTHVVLFMAAGVATATYADTASLLDFPPPPGDSSLNSSPQVHGPLLLAVSLLGIAGQFLRPRLPPPLAGPVTDVLAGASFASRSVCVDFEPET